MILLGHVATGASIGGWFDSRAGAALAGFASHGLFDVAPHGEIRDTRWEAASVAVALLALLGRRGPSPQFWGALGAVVPDFEHVLPRRIRPARKLYPTHRVRALHSSDTPLAVPAWAQVMAGGAVVGALVFAGRPPAAASNGRLTSAVRAIGDRA